jgi:murein DD-endopeptidase MepM/ murein hydrolase activator NlpD
LRATPRLVTHSWVLALGLLVPALAPLGLRQSATVVSARADTVRIPFRPSVGASVARLTSRANARVDSLDLALAAPAPTDPGAIREHIVRFLWPTQGIITQPFWAFHPGIDIANDIGTPEVAADAGQVVFAGWGSYGVYVEIDHGNGFHTIYGHMSKALVSTGQMVGRGQLIGLMGVTGRATGPHLHFEIRYQGVPQNPLDLLS